MTQRRIAFPNWIVLRIAIAPTQPMFVFSLSSSMIQNQVADLRP